MTLYLQDGINVSLLFSLTVSSTSSNLSSNMGSFKALSSSAAGIMRSPGELSALSVLRLAAATEMFRCCCKNLQDNASAIVDRAGRYFDQKAFKRVVSTAYEVRGRGKNAG